MKNAIIFWCVCVMSFIRCVNTSPVEPFPVLPKPASVVRGEGFFLLSPSTKIVLQGKSPVVAKAGELFFDMVAPATGFYFPQVKGTASVQDAIVFSLSLQKDKREGSYSLNISKERIVISATEIKGFFYALQTLRQLLPVEIESRTIRSDVEWKVAAASIQDSPQFSYRGMHLDVGRHFFPVSFIKKYIDLLALHKFNVFHWHLTEDQGWRIEIKSYPLLTEKGSVRAETVIGKNTGNYNAKPYGGYYTQDEIREVVAYAQKRFITVIPEIELPGHALAALASYPSLGCRGKGYEVATKWGVFSDVYCAGKEETFLFLEQVLSEVIELFPSKYIHIGGDEVPKERWAACTHCQRRIKKEGLHNEHELQNYFVGRIANFLRQHGRSIIGWDEILDGGELPSNAIVMSWRGMKGGIAAAKKSHYVVMSPVSHCYFDYYQALPEGEPFAIGGFTPLEKVYSFYPIPEELYLTEQDKYVAGVQGNVWTEYIKTPEQVEYMTFPRASALAEVAWSNPKKRNLKDFYPRLKRLNKRLAFLGVNFRNKLFPPEGGGVLLFRDKGQIAFSPTEPEGKIFYTLDGSAPTPQSLPYHGEITVAENTTVKAIQVVGNEVSDIVETQAIRAEAELPMAPKEVSPGVHYTLRIHDTKDEGIPQEVSGTVSMLTLPPSAPEGKGFDVNLNGFIRIDKDGLYTFEVLTQAEAMLQIGAATPSSNRSNFYLKAGLYPIALNCSFKNGKEPLYVVIKGSDDSRRHIVKSEQLFH